MAALNRRVVLIQGAFTAMQCVSTVYFVQAFQRFGYSNLLIGTIMMGTSLMSLFAQPFWGYVADKVVRDRQIIGLCCTAGGVLYLGFIFSGGFKPLVIIAAVGMYALFIPMMTLIDSFVAKLIVDGHRINYSATRAGGSVSYALTAALFGVAVSRFGMTIAPFIYLALCAVLCGALWGLPDPRNHTRARFSAGAGLRSLRGNRAYLLFVAAYFLTSLTTVPVNTYYSVVLFTLGGDERHVGLGLFFQALSEVPVMLSFDWIRKKTGLPTAFFLVLGMVFFALKNFCIAFAPNITFVLLGSMLQGLSFAVFLPATVSFLMEVVNREYLATAQMAAVTIGSSLAAIIANPAGGAIADVLGPQNMLKITGFFALAGALMMVLSQRVLQTGSRVFLQDAKSALSFKEADDAKDPA
ncbi:MAG: MFS transporter [Spirochaetaceae bacterium]|jgi:PPP family 3-phenylpropionic acid transporter|nr:MFS transporter [Spirochaetaceae bacterium]